MGAIIGFSMPYAVTFSMLELYAPDKLKFPCKCAKWSGGLIFYGVSSSVDYLTSGVENKFLGEELPIDAPELMGTLPTMADLEELKKNGGFSQINYGKIISAKLKLKYTLQSVNVDCGYICV